MMILGYIWNYMKRAKKFYLFTRITFKVKDFVCFINHLYDPEKTGNETLWELIYTLDLWLHKRCMR